MPQTSTPQGWFPSPGEPGVLRWWDGTRWTDHRTPNPNQTAQTPQPTRPAEKKRTRTEPAQTYTARIVVVYAVTVLTGLFVLVVGIPGIWGGFKNGFVSGIVTTVFLGGYLAWIASTSVGFGAVVTVNTRAKTGTPVGPFSDATNRQILRVAAGIHVAGTILAALAAVFASVAFTAVTETVFGPEVAFLTAGFSTVFLIMVAAWVPFGLLLAFVFSSTADRDTDRPLAKP